MVSQRPIGQPFLTFFFHSPQITLQEVISCSSRLKRFEVQNQVLNRRAREESQRASYSQLALWWPRYNLLFCCCLKCHPTIRVPLMDAYLTYIWPIKSWKPSIYDFLCLWSESIWWIKLRDDSHWGPGPLADGSSTDSWKMVFNMTNIL